MQLDQHILPDWTLATHATSEAALPVMSAIGFRSNVLQIFGLWQIVQRF